MGTNYPGYKETHRRANRRWNVEHRPRRRELKMRYYWLHKERLRPRRKENNRRYNERLKLRVFEHYSGVPPRCACCGEAEVQFLSLDHIHGGGGKHNKMMHGSGGVYRELIRTGFPGGYQILCMNCNFAKGKFGGCPHTLRPN